MKKYIISCILVIALLPVVFLLPKKHYHAECLPVENGCSIQVDGNTIGQFQLEVDTGGLIQPFKISASGSNIDKVNLEISGINYYMGYNHYSLLPSDNIFTYSGILPACIYRYMEWLAHVEFVSNNTTYSVDYTFSIEKQPITNAQI